MTRKLLSLLLFLLGLGSASAQMSDNGDGTFTNPVIWADMPDPDVIQVGDTFYMVSTSMHMLPGVTLSQITGWRCVSGIMIGINPGWDWWHWIRLSLNKATFSRRNFSFSPILINFGTKNISEEQVNSYTFVAEKPKLLN